MCNYDTLLTYIQGKKKTVPTGTVRFEGQAPSDNPSDELSD